MRLPSPLCFVLLIGCAFCLPALLADDAKAKKDLDSLQGAWQFAAMEGANSLSADILKELKLTFEGDRARHPGVEGKLAAATVTVNLDPSQKPKAIDITPLAGPEKGKRLPGIYSIDGDTLRICVGKIGGDRPTEFKASKDVALSVLKRAKP